MRKFQLAVIALAVLLAQLVTAQTNHPASAEVEKRVDSILSKMTLEEKIDYISGVNGFYIRAIPRLGLPAFRMSDGPIGVRNYGPATTLAGGIGLAATWDPALDHRAGVVLGEDGRARGVNFLLGPGVNIYRAPMNGRNFEYFGEDPFLASQTAVAYIEGVQSQGVCATIKHFMANNSEYDRHNVDEIIDERTLREIYLPTFEAAVKKAHVCAIMDSYNLTNGEHMTQNDYLNNEVVKKEWGFDGIIMSDWDATYDGVAAVNGGLDLEMPSGKFMNRATLLPAIQSGKVSEATIDEHVRRILRKAVQYGWLDRDQTELSIPLYNLEGRRVAVQTARESMVLLKNEGNLLPLDKGKIKTLAVIGPDAYPAEPVGGGSAGVRPFTAVDFMEGLANYLQGSAKVTYQTGIPSLREIARDTAYAMDSAGDKPGLQVEYFASTDLSGSPLRTETDTSVNFGRAPFERPLPPDFHSGRWTGYYIAKQAGKYHVVLEGPHEHGGARVYIDDKLAIDSWQLHKAIVDDAVLDLTAGPHQIRLEMYRTVNWANQLLLAIADSDTMVDPEARAIAAKADAVVVSVGFDPSTESEGGDRGFRLLPGQDELIQAMLAANKNVIVVVTSGGGVDMTAWADRAPAILESWYSGQEGGTALAELLFGEYSPSGKLPVTFDRRFEDSAVYHSYYPNGSDNQAKYTEGVFLGYRHYDKAGIKPLFPFGYGLSYTTFEYGNLSISPKTVNGDEPITVSFDVTNTGRREGAEVAELYVSDTHASVPRPAKELKGFSRVELKPGETKKATIELDRRSLSYYDAKDKIWKAEPGDFGILVGSSSANIELKGTLHLAR
jgi:beta-glucosidase